MAAQRFLTGVGVLPTHVASEALGDSQIVDDGRTPEGRALQRCVSFRFQRVAER